MADSKNSPSNYEEVMKAIEGHDRIVIEDGEGKEYTLRYTRRIVKDMEKRGVTAERASEIISNATLTGVESFINDFVAPAFKADQPNMTKAEIVELWREIPEKDLFIAYLVALFNQPMTALIKNPTETRAKFRLA